MRAEFAHPHKGAVVACIWFGGVKECFDECFGDTGYEGGIDIAKLAAQLGYNAGTMVPQ